MSRFLHANGLRMHILEEGSGPVVLLLHGFPEFSGTWRHQVRALAAAGYRVVAPDQRGYGQTDCPEREDAYTIPVGLRFFVGAYQTPQWGSFAAGSIIAAIPVMALFLFLQKYLVSGLTAGAVKG